MGSTQLAANPLFHARRKDIEVSYHFLGAFLCRGIVGLSFIRSSSQMGDLFTTGLSNPLFSQFRSKLLSMWMNAFKQ